MTRRLVLAPLVAAVVVGSAAVAEAQSWSRHAPLCRPVYPNNATVLWQSVIGGLNTGPYPVTVICPISDTSTRPDSQISEVRLYAGTPNSGGFFVRACRTARTGLQTTCGAYVGPGPVDGQVLSLPPGSTWESTDFGFLEVILPAFDFYAPPVIGYVVSSTPIAPQGQWARHQGGECRAVSGVDRSSHAVTGFGSTNTTGEHSIWLACRSDDTDEYPDSAVNEVRFYVHDASPTDGFVVRACVTYRNTEGGACSGPGTTSAGFLGGATITLSGASLDLWHDTTDFSYLLVEIPAKYGGNGFSYVKGWVTEH
jgi:hypothetical protein